MEIYLIRHTEVKGSKTICYGQSNPPLADTFLDEAAALKAKLPTDFDAIYSSPLLRCKLLAEELDFQNIQFEESLMEVNFGTWEGKLWDEIPQAELDLWMNDFVNRTPPQGESLINLNARVLAFLTKVKETQYQKIAIISHAGPIRCTLAFINNKPLKDIFEIKLAFGEIKMINL
jgi:alpha-ribazole phosphatase